jgi:hypothetical protein
MDEAGKSGNGVEIERGLERLDVEFIYKLLRQTHWARNRSREVFERAIQHSLCFGAYEGKRQVGFARVVTDHATFGYILYRKSGFAPAPNPQDLMARYLGEQPTNSELSAIGTDRVR